MAERAPQAAYSVFEASSLARRVAKTWGLRGASCAFWGRNINDTYRVESSSGVAYLRVYRHGWRPRGEIEGEVALLRLLARKGLGVAAPLRRRDGGYVALLRAPEGPRAAVLFAEAPGAPPAMDVPNSRDYGRLVGRFHAIADTARALERPRIDLESLAVQPVRRIAEFWASRPRDVADLKAVAEELGAEVARRLPERAPEFGLCHGDLHFNNVLRDSRGTMRLIDFDGAGYGWRSHDVSVFLWSRGWSFARRASLERERQWEAFLEGYARSRRLSAIERDTARLFVPLHQLWVMGLWIAQRDTYGRRWLTDAHFDTHLAFIRGWMKRLR